MKAIRRITALLLAVILLCSVGLASYAQENDVKTLKVGYLDYDGFIEKNPDGTYSGYAVDYLEEIAKYTDYKYVYVYGEGAELLNELANGEIDLLCNIQYTEARTAVYDYSSYPIGYTQGLLYTAQDNDELCYEDYQAFDGITVGTLHASAMTAIFDVYAQQHGFTYKTKEYETDEALLDGLNSGEIDAMCCEHLAMHDGLSLLANFGADAYYIVSYKDSPYIADIDSALQQIKADVDFEAMLFHKYYDESTAESTVQFTLEEKQYIKNAEPIVVGLMPDRSPLSYEDENGRAAGMIKELMELVSFQSGLKFEYRFLDQGQTGYDFLTNCGGQLVAGVGVSAFSKLNPVLLQSETLQLSSIVFVGRDGTDFGSNAKLTVALPAGFINGKEVVSEKYPNFDFYVGTTNEDCLSAIRDGKADVMLQNLYVIRECLQSPLYDGLDIFPAFSFDEEEKIVTLPENELLLSILNKSMESLTDEQRDMVVIDNTIAKSYHAKTSEIIYKYRFPLIGIAVLLVVVIAMILVFFIVRQRNYNAIAGMNTELEKSNSRLEDALIQADRANEAKSSFLSRMSHEIRTPMNAIVGLTEIAKQHENEPERLDDYLGKIAISSKVLLNILNDVLDMSAIESGKLKISVEKFDIKQVLDSISTIYYPQCKSKGVTFDMATDVEDEFLLGDSLRVSQILLNLVSNAYKFTPKGGKIHIAVSETARKENKAFLRFSVADTGCGISEEMKERLFKPFEQETASTAKQHGGSGLGLSIAKNLADMMQGAISVDSEKGRGTTFMVDLPFEIAEKSHQQPSDALKNIRILAVDDDELARNYTATVLKRIGAEFDIATSGSEALDMVSKAQAAGKPYDIALIDWKMQDINGVEVTRRIRMQDESKTTIIIVSAYDLNEVHDEAISAGADHFVSKPLFQSTVFNILMSLTKGDIVSSGKKTKKYDFTGHKILLTEDQELNAEIALELLNLVNMSADHAHDGKQAVEMLEAAAPGTYDAILMDVQMPVMDGYEAAAAIRALSRPDAATIQIYAMTANAFTEDVSAALSAGMNGHIAKPINTDILYETLEKAIEYNERQKRN